MNIKTIVALAILVSFFTVFTASAAYTMDDYGGISRSADHPPENTTLNPELSAYYGVPVATGDNDQAYWYYVGRWYTSEEVTNLPSETIIHGVSPYDVGLSSSGSKDNSQAKSNVAMPISNYAVLAFAGVVLFVSTKVTKSEE